MSLPKSIEKIKYIDFLIRLKCTGSPKELAEKLGVSERTVYSYLETMQELGATIYFDRNCMSYLYKEIKEFKIGFEPMKQVKGGNCSNAYLKFQNSYSLN